MQTSSDVTIQNISLKFFLPSAKLAPYISTYYHMNVDLPDGGQVKDSLHPEWGNIRFLQMANAEASVGNDPLREIPKFVAAGPTSYATQFSVTKGRSWGIGLLPLGWLKFVGAPANKFADGIFDGAQESAFAAFAPLSDILYRGTPNLVNEVARIESHLQTVLDRSLVGLEQVMAVHSALVDSNHSTATELATAANLSARTLERMSLRVFGFSPGLLLRRQRFLRSLAKFMLDPSLSWLDMLDSQYYDQAQFIRDFRRFMNITPGEYAKNPHPILMAAARARSNAVGAAVQALHLPYPARDLMDR